MWVRTSKCNNISTLTPHQSPSPLSLITPLHTYTSVTLTLCPIPATSDIQAEELSEASVKVSRLEKKVAGAEEESGRKVAREKEETAKFREALDKQER